MKRTNVLLIIVSDTGRYLECYGADVKTPHINRLSEEGLLFTNYFCTAPMCSPSRASMFSGLTPHNHGMIGNAHRGFSLKPGIPYLPKILSQHGYHTYLFGLQHETNKRGQALAEELGYQHYFIPGEHIQDVLPLLIDFLKNNPPQPFFISCGVEEAHKPYPEVKQVPNNLRVPSFLPPEPEVKKDIAGLNILVERIDSFVGEIIKVLRETGLEENTLLVLTTEHGVALPGAKGTLFDPGIEILLIMRGPDGFSGGKEVNALLSNLDFAPTILDYLGIEIPREVQGVSFLPVVRGEKEEVREEIYMELTYHAAYDPMRGIRNKRFKYIRSFEVRPWYFPPNIDDGPTKDLFKRMGYYNKIRPFEYLFDLSEDPEERKNLAGLSKYDKILREMRRKLIAWMEETNDPLLKGPVPLPEGGIVSPPWAYSPDVTWDERDSY